MRTTRISRIFPASDARRRTLPLILSLLLVPVMLAQTELASIIGVVTDPDGGAVASIPVQLKNAATGAAYAVSTSASGSYTLASLPPGAYEMSVPAVGFTLDRFEKKDIVLAPAQMFRLDIRMAWGSNLGTPGDDPSIFLRSKYAAVSGAAPRTRDGKPDLTGLWNGNDDPNPQDPEALPAAAALAKERRENKEIDAPSTRCLPSSVPPMGPLLWKLVQAPSVLIMLFEDLPGFRQIYLDGRAHPKDWNPSWMGHSIGAWEGNTLVVDTVGFNDKSWIGDYSHTESLHVVERYTRRDLGHLDVQITMEDPGTFVKPWTVKAVWNLAPGDEMLEYVCSENNKDVSHLVGK